jgi:hypothetical protein
MKRLVKKAAVGCLLSLAALSAYASTVTVVNNTPYAAEVSGSVGVSSGRVLLQPHEKTQLTMQANSVTHVMLITTNPVGYQDNVLLRMTSGQLFAVALYDRVVARANNQRVELLR